MPQYTFECQDCHKTFTQFMHMADLEKGGVKCPHCGSEKVEHLVEAFFAKTAKKT